MSYKVEDNWEYKMIGQPMEIKAQNVIKKAYNVDIIETCNNSDYDFKDSNNVTYEVKADQLSITTGNFFIAYSQKYPFIPEFISAGISKSKADYHLITYGESFYKIKTADIRHILMSDNKGKYLERMFINARNEYIKGFLLKVEDIKPYAIIYNCL